MAEPYPDPDRDRTGNGGTLTGSLESRGRPEMAESETSMSASPIGIKTAQIRGAGTDDGGTLSGSRQ